MRMPITFTAVKYESYQSGQENYSRERNTVNFQNVKIFKFNLIIKLGLTYYKNFKTLKYKLFHIKLQLHLRY